MHDNRISSELFKLKGRMQAFWGDPTGNEAATARGRRAWPVMMGMGVVVALVSGCQGAETKRPVVTSRDVGASTSSPAGTEVAGRDRSLVRLVNALPGQANVDVGGDDRTVFANVAYKTVTPYVEMGSNHVSFHLRRAGRDSTISTNTETMTDGYRYTIVAMPGLRGDDARLIVLRDELLPDAGKARLRIINAAPGVIDADVAVQGQKDALFENIDYSDEAGYKDITPMMATLEIRRDSAQGRSVLLRDMQFEAGKAYTIILTGARPGTVETISFDDTVVRGLAAGAVP